MKNKLNLISAFGLCAAALVSTPQAEARNVIVKQDYPSGVNVYRVEIRNLTRLEVLEAGDSDGVGELHEVVVQLDSFNPDSNTQYDGIKFTGTELYLINKGGIVGGRKNMPIKVGQHVRTSQRSVNRDETQMWVHVYSNPDNPSDYEDGRVRLQIHALELDCVGNRLCRRNSQGSTSISFKVPDFKSPPSNRCGPSNTFRLEKLDGELQISGLSGTQVRSRVRADSPSDPWWLLTKHKKGGPRLQPFNADICIASTTRPSAIRRPSEAERDLSRSNRR
ncbi:MAG: hypothetical protein ABJN65_12070 [Parasphingorhabdus sp.]